MGITRRWNRDKPHSGMMFREPKAINITQIITNLTAAITGALAVAGGFPVILDGQIGPILSAMVGSILVIGGLVGAASVLWGNWWLERVALMVTGLGWILIMPAALSFAISGRSTGGIWLVVALLFAAIGDIVKRYLRIQWAYLDPRR